MTAKEDLGFYEERLTRLVTALSLLPETWHGEFAQEFNVVGRIPLARWEFFLRIAMLYAAGISVLNFLGRTDQEKFPEDLTEILNTVFLNAKKPMTNTCGRARGRRHRGGVRELVRSGISARY